MQYLKFIFYPALHLFIFAIIAVLIDPVLGVIYFIIAMYLLFKNKRIPKEDIESEKEAKRIKEKEHLLYILSESKKGHNHKAMYELSHKIFYGEGVEKNYVDAWYWAFKSDQLGNADAPRLRRYIEMYASATQIEVAKKRIAEENKNK